MAQILKPNFCTFSISVLFFSRWGGHTSLAYSRWGLTVTDTVEIMLVVLHAYKIYGKEAPITYELWYKLIQYALTMTSLNSEESPGT